MLSERIIVYAKMNSRKQIIFQNASLFVMYEQAYQCHSPISNSPVGPPLVIRMTRSPLIIRYLDGKETNSGMAMHYECTITKKICQLFF
jgi:hypothetical protein